PVANPELLPGRSRRGRGGGGPGGQPVENTGLKNKRPAPRRRAGPPGAILSFPVIPRVRLFRPPQSVASEESDDRWRSHRRSGAAAIPQRGPAQRPLSAPPSSNDSQTLRQLRASASSRSRRRALFRGTPRLADSRRPRRQSRRPALVRT